MHRKWILTMHVNFRLHICLYTLSTCVVENGGSTCTLGWWGRQRLIQRERMWNWHKKRRNIGKTANIFSHPVWSIFSHSHASASQRAKLHDVHARKQRSFVLLSASVNQELAVAKTEYQCQKKVAAESLECKWNYKQIGSKWRWFSEFSVWRCHFKLYFRNSLNLLRVISKRAC